MEGTERPMSRERNGRTAVVMHRESMWVDTFACILARLRFTVLSSSTERELLLSLVEEHRPDLLVTELGAKYAVPQREENQKALDDAVALVDKIRKEAR